MTELSIYSRLFDFDVLWIRFCTVPCETSLCYR